MSKLSSKLITDTETNLADTDHLMLLLFQPAENLIKEIAVLELEVVYLEQYLLSLYRKTFDRQISSVTTVNDRLKSSSTAHKLMFQEVSGDNMISKTENSVSHSGHLSSPRVSFDNPPKECNDIWGAQKLLDSSIHRSHSSLSHRSTCPTRTSPSMQILAKAIDSYHSLPLSMLEVTYSIHMRKNQKETIYWLEELS